MDLDDDLICPTLVLTVTFQQSKLIPTSPHCLIYLSWAAENSQVATES